MQTNESNLWNEFVDNSPQGSICSKTFWLNCVCEKYNIVGCFKNDELVGGIAFEEKKVMGFSALRSPMLTQSLGIIYKDNSAMNPIKRISLERDILEEILSLLESRYKRIAINNHFTVQDIRTFTWRDYRPFIRYSYIIDLTEINITYSNFESRNKGDIKKSKKNDIEIFSTDNVKLFFDLHKLTYERQNLKCPISYSKTKIIFTALNTLSKCKIYFAKDPQGNICSTIFVAWDNDVAYYLMGASHPNFRSYGSVSLALWTAMQELAEMGIKHFDLYGANTPSIAFFKRGFGGELKQYYRLEKYNSRFLYLTAQGFEIFKFITNI